MILNPVLLCDFYKLSHRRMYPEGTQYVYSTWTPRKSYIPEIKEVICFGLQAFLKNLNDTFRVNFFERNFDVVALEYGRFIKYTLGDNKPDTTHLRELWDLGYLPLEFRALAEGTRVPLRVPMITVRNTDPRFFWLTNYIETLMSCELWMPMTSATIADQYRKVMNKWAMKTTGSVEGVQFLGHDFSMRGMANVRAAAASGAGHLLSFVGTDTCPAIDFLEQYYHADIEKELVGTSVPASEHSVMCSYGKDSEFDCYKRLMTEVHPHGFLSVVSDTWDLWKVISDVIAPLKDTIMARDGKVVVRPDSGDPVLILCGNPFSTNPAENKGVVELLWDIFGGTINENGYKVLHPAIGCIYGDAITLERCAQICEYLEVKGFASTNVVYGIGSYSYQFNTRDTFGFAMKSTAVVVNGEERMIFKDPVTDTGTKKSAKGRVVVIKDPVTGGLIVEDQMDIFMDEKQEHPLEFKNDELKLVYRNGAILAGTTLSVIRNYMNSTR